MHVILTMAISANGLIATDTGSEDFLGHENWLQFVKLAHKVGCFIWGRKTYEAVLAWEGDYLSQLEGVTKVVVSESDLSVQGDFTQATSPERALSQLSNLGFKQAIVTGGAKLNSAFAQLGLIDEVILDVNPVIIGQGLPVFAPQEFQLNLELQDVSKVNETLVELRYLVVK